MSTTMVTYPACPVDGCETEFEVYAEYDYEAATGLASLEFNGFYPCADHPDECKAFVEENRDELVERAYDESF